MMMVAEQFDYKRNPLRGILTEIARERGITRQSVQKSFKRGNPFIVEAVTKKIMERELMVKEYQQLMNRSSDEDHDVKQSSE